MAVDQRTTRLFPAMAVGGFAAFLGIAVVLKPSIISLVTPVMAGTLLVVALVHRLRPDDEELAEQILRWAILSLYGHLIIGLIVTNTNLLYYLGPDAVGYHTGAVQILNHWNHGAEITQRIPAGKEGFYYALAGMYWLFGVSTSAGLALNASLAACLVPLLADSTRRLFGVEAARRVPALAVALPGLLVWTSQLLKEACVLFLIACAVNCALRLADRFSPGPVLLLTATVATLLTFRSQVGFVLSAGIFLGLVLGKRHVLGGLGTGLSVISVGAVLVIVFGLGYAGFHVALQADLGSADTVRRDLSETANSGFAAQSDVSSVGGAVSYLPTGVTAFLFGPFPWQINGVRGLPALADVMVWWYLLPSLWRGQRLGRRLVGRRIGVLLLPAVATTLVLSLSAGNFGIVVRERTQIVMLVLPIIALGLAERSADPTSIPVPAVAVG